MMGFNYDEEVSTYPISIFNLVRKEEQARKEEIIRISDFSRKMIN
jgi:hypothetical protein